MLDPVPPEFDPKPGLRKAAVLVTIAERTEGDVLVCTRRHESMRAHAGQISFPGGRRDPGEQPRTTALRETDEEIGVPATRVEVFGAMPARFSVAGFWVHPIVGRIPRDHPLTPAEDEVARIVEFPLRELSEPDCWDLRPPSHGRSTTLLPHFDYDGEVLWGLTARFVLDLLERSGNPPLPNG
ncbi:MAG: CoA pyrophosphatase [Planctomycetota bacterium]